MKSSIVILFIFLLLIEGCSASKETENYTPPALLLQTPLPPLPPLHPLLKNISVALHIDSLGTVTAVRFLKGSLNPSWDSSAAQQIKTWRFAPALYEGKPIAMWYRYNFSLLFTEAKPMILAEILCETKEMADSLYLLLKDVNNFFELAKRFSIAETRIHGGFIGEVNIYSYPKSVWSVLEKLQPGEITPPVPQGRYYAIFKRLITHPL